MVSKIFYLRRSMSTFPHPISIPIPLLTPNGESLPGHVFVHQAHASIVRRVFVKIGYHPAFNAGSKLNDDGNVHKLVQAEVICYLI